MKKFDVAVIGAGPGGYVAAIKLAQLGIEKVACIDNSNLLGGTCLNVGCIPSKSLLYSSHKYSDALSHFKEHGIEFDNIKLSLSNMMKRKGNIVQSLGNGIEFLFKKNKITRFQGKASFISNSELQIIDKQDAIESIYAEKIIIATGSSPILPDGINADEKQIVTSTGALSLERVPDKMIVLGGGVVGLEMASIWSRLGAKVHVIEYSDRILASGDTDISKEAEKIFKGQGIEFILSHKLLSAYVGATGKVQLKVECASSNKKTIMECDVLLSSIGRAPNTKDLLLENVGVQLDDRGRIITNNNFQTNIENIFAIGDVKDGMMLAHKASEEGVAVAQVISGQKPHIDYNKIPSVVYTTPEIASVGYSEDQLKKLGKKYNIAKFPFAANSRAKTMGSTYGFVKLLSCKESNAILGGHIISENAGDLMAELVVAMEFRASAGDLAMISHSHPSLSEAVKEAAMLLDCGKALHI
ncbi:MAG: dihydrolipoyl dehydrogenase [Proteobacteria bacterium]|nr:dihydrolipoyl dehydrogenase [Pseudomonadota bacterium]